MSYIGQNSNFPTNEWRRSMAWVRQEIKPVGHGDIMNDSLIQKQREEVNSFSCNECYKMTSHILKHLFPKIHFLCYKHFLFHLLYWNPSLPSIILTLPGLLYCDNTPLPIVLDWYLLGYNKYEKNSRFNSSNGTFQWLIKRTPAVL